METVIGRNHECRMEKHNLILKTFFGDDVIIHSDPRCVHLKKIHDRIDHQVGLT